MKLGLLMLTTVITMITERQVEADLECYEKRGLTGRQAIIKKSTKDTKAIFPNGIKACKVSKNSIWILYNLPNFTGEVNTIYSTSDKVYLPRSLFEVKSILRLKFNKKGVFLFPRGKFQEGKSHKFVKETENVIGKFTFRSAVVIGQEPWTIVSQCQKKSSCRKKCLTCLQPTPSGASFIRLIDDGLGEPMGVLLGCYGKNFTGKSNVPECPCNPKGTVDGPAKCEGKNGICHCKTNHTGADCGQCKSPHLHHLRHGDCVAIKGCGCNKKGVNRRYPCFDGECNCLRFYTGKLCDDCYYFGIDDKCFFTRCAFYNTISEDKYDGFCKCKPHYKGKCDECKKGYYEVNKKCLNKTQFEKVEELIFVRDHDKNNKKKYFDILNDLVNLGVLAKASAKSRKRFVNRGWYTPGRSAGFVITSAYEWLV